MCVVCVGVNIHVVCIVRETKPRKLLILNDCRVTLEHAACVVCIPVEKGPSSR